jgi:hypothetical protein
MMNIIITMYYNDNHHHCQGMTANFAGLLQDREEAGFQGAASPLTEREVSSPPPFSLPSKAAK